MPETIENTAPKALPPPRQRPWTSRRAIGAGALIAVLVAGAALGAGGTRMAQLYRPQSVMLLQPGAINQMSETSVVAIKGEVADIFGNKFVLQDASGRALIDTGPRGEGRAVAAKGETLTVQGRFERGIVRAEVIVHADGRNEAFGPPKGPKGGPDGPKGPKGPKGKEGPKGGPLADRDGPPPPPADRGPNRDAPPPPAAL